MADVVNLDNLKARFTAAVAEHPLKCIEVEGLGAVWFRPQAAMNAAEYNQFIEAAKAGTFEAMVDILMLRARREDGRKIFAPRDKNDLMRQVSGDDIQHMVNQILEADDSEGIDVKKS